MEIPNNGGIRFMRNKQGGAGGRGGSDSRQGGGPSSSTAPTSGLTEDDMKRYVKTVGIKCTICMYMYVYGSYIYCAIYQVYKCIQIFFMYAYVILFSTCYIIYFIIVRRCSIIPCVKLSI